VRWTQSPATGGTGQRVTLGLAVQSATRACIMSRWMVGRIAASRGRDLTGLCPGDAAKFLLGPDGSCGRGRVPLADMWLEFLDE